MKTKIRMATRSVAMAFAALLIADGYTFSVIQTDFTNGTVDFNFPDYKGKMESMQKLADQVREDADVG